MEDNKNKPAAGAGARDISDLKARLGMKKGPAGAVPAPGGVPAPGAVPSPVPAAGGFAGATGAAVPAPIPAPPGFPTPAPAEAAPSQPQVDPRRDPFAAAQPAAAPAYYGYAPLPGLDDGKPAEQIDKPKPWGNIGIAAVVAAAVFGLGYGCGGIKWMRGNMNRTIDQASDIKAEVDKMAKTVSTVQDVIAPTAENAKLTPVEMAERLGQVDFKKPDTEKLFHTNYFYIPDDLVIDTLFNYYNDTLLLHDRIAQHVKKTENDKESIENFLKSQGAGGGQRNYAVNLDPSGPLLLAAFAELGSPVCNDEKATDCPADQMKGFKYRTDLGGQWFVKPVKGTPAQVVIPIKPSPLFTQLAKGSPDMLAAEGAARRMAEIRLLVAKVGTEQKELQTGLDKAADPARKVKEYLLF